MPPFLLFAILAVYSQYDVLYFNAIIKESQSHKGENMIIFDRLWNTMKDKNISQYTLIHTHGISESQLTRLRKNGIVKTEILNKLCVILDCNIEDVCEFIKDI